MLARNVTGPLRLLEFLLDPATWRCTTTLLFCGQSRMHGLQTPVANEQVRLVNNHFQPVWRTIHHRLSSSQPCTIINKSHCAPRFL